MCDQLSCDYKLVTASSDSHGIYMNRHKLPTVTQYVSHALRDSNAHRDSQYGMRIIIFLSYPFFLYCCHFPSDFRIVRSRMIHPHLLIQYYDTKFVS